MRWPRSKIDFPAARGSGVKTSSCEHPPQFTGVNKFARIRATRRLRLHMQHILNFDQVVGTPAKFAARIRLMVDLESFTWWAPSYCFEGHAMHILFPIRCGVQTRIAFFVERCASEFREDDYRHAPPPRMRLIFSGALAALLWFVNDPILLTPSDAVDCGTTPDEKRCPVVQFRVGDQPTEIEYPSVPENTIQFPTCIKFIQLIRFPLETTCRR